jgi:hypothetical protein
VQGSDVEVYAVALLALVVLLVLLLGYRRRPTDGMAAGCGLALGVAVLFHLTHVLATPLVASWTIHHARRRGDGIVHACIASVTGGATALAGYAWAAFAVRRLDLLGALAWVRSASHGLPYGGDPVERIGDSVYGMARALVWSPYLYERDAQRLLGQFVLGLSALGLLLALIVVRRRLLPPLPRLPLALWAAPYAAMALCFFGSDHERWLFLLPLLWLLGGAALATLRRGLLAGASLVALLAAANAFSAIGPAMHERWNITRADDAASVMADGDLVLCPGHSWDEYIGFSSRRRLTVVPLVYYAGLLGRQGTIARVGEEVRAARARKANVWAVRLLDEDDGDPRGTATLAALGLPRSELRAMLAPMHPTPVRTVEPKVTVWRLDR